MIRPLGVAASVVSDIFATAFAFGFSLWLRHVIGGWSLGTGREYTLLLAFIVVLWPVALWISGCYERRRRLSPLALVLRVFRALVIAYLVLALVVVSTKAHFLSRGVMVIFFPSNLAAIMFGRLMVALVFGGPRPRTLIVGTGWHARRVSQVLTEEEKYHVLGFIRVHGDVQVPEGEVLGDAENARAILAEQSPLDDVTIALPPEELCAAKPVVEGCEERGITICQLVCPLGERPRSTSRKRIRELDFLRSRETSAHEFALLLKRLMDIVGSLVGLFLTALVFPFVAAVVKLSSKGGLFFKQERVGLNGRTFTMYKFRTMVDGAHEVRAQLAHLNEAEGPHFKVKNDPRITRAGRLLRRASIDELPQFWSVMRGDMSLVGPRPFPVEEVERHEGSHYRRLSMKPGITGIWQTSGRSEVKDFEKILRMDEEYIRNWSLWLDFKILLKTIPAVIGGRGAV